MKIFCSVNEAFIIFSICSCIIPYIKAAIEGESSGFPPKPPWLPVSMLYFPSTVSTVTLLLLLQLFYPYAEDPCCHGSASCSAHYFHQRTCTLFQCAPSWVCGDVRVSSHTQCSLCTPEVDERLMMTL